MSETILTGIGVSKGIRIGKAFIYKPTSVDNKLIKETIEEAEIPQELKRLEKAKIESYQGLEDLIEQVSESLGKTKATILKAQQSFLNDPSFYPEVQQMIKQQKYSAEKSVIKVVEHFSNIFLNLKDEYLRERISDLKDLEKRLISNLTNNKRMQFSDINEEVILIADDLTPSDTVQLNKDLIKAFMVSRGGKTSHTAIFARTLGIPAIVGIGENIEKIQNGTILIIDGEDGLCIVNPEQCTIEKYQDLLAKELEEIENLKKYISRPAKTQDGFEIEIAANVGNPNEAKMALEKGAEGIGLYRTELLFMNSDHLPTEDEQYKAYKDIALIMGEKSLIIRTLDIGGDKELSYFSFPKELNPFLGYRAIRLTLDQKEIFLTQLRAILRASVHGRIRIMFPMISNLQEWRQAKNLVKEAKQQLTNEGISYDEHIELGIMIEIPSAAIIAEQFAKEVDFFSIGTNDLVQYTLAVDRMNEKVAYLYDYFHPAVIQLIKKTIDASHKEGKWTGMCGSMAGDPFAAPLLLGLGLDEWSMDAGSISRVKQVISKLDQKNCRFFASEILRLGTSEDIKHKTKEFYDQFII